MKNGKFHFVWFLVLVSVATGCVSNRAIQEVTPQGFIDAQAPDFSQIQKGPKYRVAIGRFEDKTNYNNNLFTSDDNIATRASDMLAAHLVKSDRVIVLERLDKDVLEKENMLQEVDTEKSLVWSNAMILGSVVELGTKTDYQVAGFQKTKVQTAHAKVAIRLVDPNTGVTFYSEFGEANAKNINNMKMGFGGVTGYDGTLLDKALNGAIVKLINNLMINLIDRPWEARVLDVTDGRVVVGAGEYTGIYPGDILDVYQAGKIVVNPSTNGKIQLPGEVVGQLEVVEVFGTNELDEGAFCEPIGEVKVTLDHIVRLAKNTEGASK